VARTDLISSYLGQIAQRLDATEADRLLEELEGHLHDAVARHRAAGLPPQEAVRHALQECGSVAAVVTAVTNNSEREERMMATTRWTGLAGIAAVPAALAGVMFWHPVTFVLTFALAGFAVIGLLAAHWHASRNLIIAGLALLVVGYVVATSYPQGSAHLLYTVGLPAAFTLAAVTLACVAFLRQDTIPAPATLLVLGGVWVLLGVNTALYVGGAEPPYLASVGAVAAIAGWLWMNGSLVVRGFMQRPVSA
jgi:hypothetical protein